MSTVFVSLPQVAEALRQDLDDLSEAVVDAIWGVLPGYAGEHLHREELERFARPHLELIVTTLAAGRRPTVDELELAVRLGASRALQGVPAPSMIQAYRIAERTFVQAFLALAVDLSRPVLAEGIELLGGAVDDLTRASVDAYRVVQNEITAHYDHLESDLVHHLATSDEIDETDVADRVRRVGADPDSAHLAVALGWSAAAPATAGVRLRRQLLADVASLLRGRILSGSWGRSTLLIVPCEVPVDRLLGAVQRALGRSDRSHGPVAGVGEPADRLALVGRSCREALAALEVGQRLRRAGEAVQFVDVIPEVLLLRDRPTSRRLVAAWLGDLVDAPHLLETLRAYLNHDMSVRRTAEALHVHPNTVTYRLRRVCERSGRDPHRPSDAIDLSLAVRTLDLLAAPVEW